MSRPHNPSPATATAPHPPRRRECEIVAEIGTAVHSGAPEHAEQLIAELAAAGAHAIKTQIIIADEITHPAAIAQIGGGAVSIHQRFRELERRPSFYRRLQRLCEENNIAFFASVFGEQSAQQAIDLGCPRIKIASPEVNHTPLLRRIAKSGVPVVLSGGVSKLGDIEAALDILGREQTTLLHCVTAYPADPTDYNLRLLDHYAALFSVSVGVSDHTRDPLLIPSVALLHDTTMIEKHTHLGDTNGSQATAPHLDAGVAITPQELGLLAAALRELAAVESRAEQIRLLHTRYSPALIAAVEGSGAARLTAAEAPLYETTNRSLHAIRAIRRGEQLTAANCAILRGESLGGGLAPALWGQGQGQGQLRGARAQHDIAAGAGIELAMLLEIDKR